MTAPRYIAGETYPGYRHHLREIGGVPPNYGGHAVKPLSLCGRPLAWDTKIPVAGFRECAACAAAVRFAERRAVTATKSAILAHLHRLESRIHDLSTTELNTRRDCEIALGMTDAKHETMMEAAYRVTLAIAKGAQ